MTYAFHFLGFLLKPLSVTNNSVGLRTAAAGNEGAAFMAHVARSGRSRIDAVICNWKGLEIANGVLKSIKEPIEIHNNDNLLQKMAFQLFKNVGGWLHAQTSILVNDHHLDHGSLWILEREGYFMDMGVNLASQLLILIKRKKFLNIRFKT